MRVCFVATTEEELLLMWSVCEELRKGGVETLFVRAGGGERFDGIAGSVGARFDESIGAGDVSSCAATVLERLPRILENFKPHWVVVHGANGCGVAAAVAAHCASFPVTHIGSGLRFGRRLGVDGKEACRRATEALSSILLAPTQRAHSNLLSENHPPQIVHTTGSTLTNTLIRVKKRISADGSIDRIKQRLLGKSDASLLLLLVEHKDVLSGVLQGLERVGEFLSGVRIVVVPLDGEFEDAGGEFFVCGDVGFVEVLGAAVGGVVVTDVGWVVEAAVVFGFGVVLMAEATDRPDAVETGWAVLSGLEKQRVVKAAVMMLKRWVAPHREPFKGKDAAARVAAILTQNRQ